MRTRHCGPKTEQGGLLGYTDSQSRRSLPLVGPPRGGTARSSSIQGFSRLCPGKHPQKSNGSLPPQGRRLTGRLPQLPK